MDDNWTRRRFLNVTAGSAAALALAGMAPDALSEVGKSSGLRGRFLTHVSVVRVNQIEVTPTRSIGEDESADNRPERIRSRRDAFARGCPGGSMTWAISWLALIDPRPEYKEARKLLASYHDRYGDEITFIPGGYFAPMYDDPRAQPADHRQGAGHDLADGRRRIPAAVPGGRLSGRGEPAATWPAMRAFTSARGRSGASTASTMATATAASAIPITPAAEHYLKPAQGPADFIDCVCLDGWTCDFLTARREGFEGGFNSRMGVGPIETVGNLGVEAGRREMMATTAMHFDRGCELNGFGFVTGIWEVSVGHDDDLAWWLQAVRERWPDTQVVTEGAFGLEWRKHVPNNANLNYRFDAKGTGAPGSEKNLEIEWFMNREFRLGLLRDWTTNSPWMAIDFTRYDLPAHEPDVLQREWSLMNVLNQKGTRPQDKPLRLGQLSPEDQRRIYARYPDMKNLA